MQRKSQMIHQNPERYNMGYGQHIKSLKRYNIGSGWLNLEKHNIRKCETYTLDNINLLLLLLLLRKKIFHSLTSHILFILFLQTLTQTSICPNAANWYVTDKCNSHNMNQ
jgi:hypothetical protein